MPLLDIPTSISTSIEAHHRWLRLVREAEQLVDGDLDIQQKAANSFRLRSRRLPPEVVGRTYACYCDLLNRMYDAYLNSVHLQRMPYMMEIISLVVKRLYELRNELEHIIVNDYIYVDGALAQSRMTPYDIQVIVPYHIPLESRPNTMENMLQKMWADAVRRRNRRPKMKTVKAKPSPQVKLDGGKDFGFLTAGPVLEVNEADIEEEDKTIVESVHTVIPEEYTNLGIIQRQERFRQHFVKALKQQCNHRRAYFAVKVPDSPLEYKNMAAEIVQKAYRRYMQLKRKKIDDLKRDFLLGIIPDPFKDRLDFEEENRKMYDRRRRVREKIQEPYKRESERENERLIFYKKEDQIDDITEQVHEWFKEWYYGYGFFPEFPYEVDGGTMLVMTGQYKTIEEKMLEDEKYIKATKGKTKEQLKNEKENAKKDAEEKAELAKEKLKAEHEKMVKMRYDPFSDPGYKVLPSDVAVEIAAALRKYRGAWSIYDSFPPDTCAETIYGYMKPVITEELMYQLHKDCRVYVDELMRLEMKLLIKMQQKMYKRVGWKWPRQRPRTRPRVLPIPNVLTVDDDVLKSLEDIFDLNIITKPKSRIKDVCGDFNFAAYDMNIEDADAKFPPPSYGDIKRRLVLSCVLGSGVEPSATRNKAVMLVGPPRNGKSFLVDCVAGEMNAVKIDISPASIRGKRAGRILVRAFTAAKVLQPAVIYCRDIEKVFAKKVLPKDRKLRASALKKPLSKLINALSDEDKIIFIATCSYPESAKARPMVQLFSEIILVPRTDYGTLRMFFYEKLQSIRSMPRDYCVQPLALMLQGYGLGVVMEIYRQVMTAERIVRLNVTPLSAAEFLEPLIANDVEPITMEEYEKYMSFCLNNGPLKQEREEYDVINAVRKQVYAKAEERAAKKQKKIT